MLENERYRLIFADDNYRIAVASFDIYARNAIKKGL